MATISAPLVTGITAGGSSTISGTFTAGAPTGLSQVLDGTTTTPSSPTITTTSGSGATAAGTYSYVITTPAAGAHSITVNGTGTYAATGTATSFTTVNWYLLHDTTWTGGPVAAVSAGAVLQDGWVDLSGGSFTIDTNNYLNAANNKFLDRPTSEDKQDIQFVERVLYSNTQDIYLSARFNRNGASPSCYMGRLQATGGNMQFAKYVAGAYTSLGGQVISGLTAGTLYDVTFSVVQANSTTTTLTLSVANTSGTVLGTYSITDTTAALQNISGAAALNGEIASGSAGPSVARLRTYTDVAATSYTLTGPATGTVSVASSNFSVTPNGGVSSAVTVTPSDGGAGGTFTPSTVTIPAGSAQPQTFTYTASSTGTKTISTTSGGALTDPASVSYASNPPPFTLGVTSPAVKFSPGNWKGDTGRGGTVYRQSWNIGAWFSFTWTAGATPTATLLMGNTSTSNLLAIFLNGVLTDAVAANANIALSGITPSASNTVVCYITYGYSLKWNNGGSNVQLLGMQIDGGSTAGVAPVARPWAMIVGDSITEGIHTESAAPQESHILDYSFFVGRGLDQLGYDVGISACTNSGWLSTGDTIGDVPAYYVVSGSSGGVGGTYSESTSRWDKIDQGVSLLDSAGQISAYGATGTPPAIIMINYMTNEAVNGKVVSDSQASVTQCIGALRAAAPNALICIIVPFGLYASSAIPAGPSYITALKAGIAAYQTANPGDLRTVLIDLGPTLAATIQNGQYINTDNIHPTGAGHALIAPQVMGKLTQALLTPTPRYRYR